MFLLTSMSSKTTGLKAPVPFRSIAHAAIFASEAIRFVEMLLCAAGF